MLRKILTVFFTLQLQVINAQNLHFKVGTDIPYQFSIGIGVEHKSFGLAFETGVLTPPYSNAILNIIEALGTDELYINLLNSSFSFGSMNALQPHYLLGKNKNWAMGLDLRYDFLTASDAPTDVIEQLLERNLFTPLQRNRTVSMSLGLLGTGLRLSRRFPLGKTNNHQVQIELSAIKHIGTITNVQLNNLESEVLSKEVNTLLWDDVFKPYGYVGGLGVKYIYKFRKQ